jgi:hypothetical protein
MAQWTLDPARLVQGSIENIEKVRRIYAFEILRRVIMRSPVDSGRFRSNWLVSLGNETSETRDAIDKSGNSALKEGQAIIDKAEGDNVIVIQNNVSYGAKIEYGGFTKKPETAKTIGGWSKQAPKGVVGITLSQAGQIFQAAVNVVKSGKT